MIILYFAILYTFLGSSASCAHIHGKDGEIVMYSLNATTTVKNRYATTLVTARTRNLARVSQEVSFTGILPETAYVSHFEMETCGIIYKGVVVKRKDLKEKRDINNNTFSLTLSSFLKSANRNYHKFTVSLHVKPRSKVIFRLVYEGLLKRNNHRYQIFSHIYPGQLVKDYNIEIRIEETRPLKFVNLLPFKTGENQTDLTDLIELKRLSERSAMAKFNPSLERQKELIDMFWSMQNFGLSGQFGVEYDVERNEKGGELLVGNGLFAHFFAPTNLISLNKHVIFVLDTSGSMKNFSRIQELKKAMNRILPELKEGDVFNIVQFTHEVYLWNVEKNSAGQKFTNSNKNERPQYPPAFKVTEENIKKAQATIERFQAIGGTDIKLALEMALNLVKREKIVNPKSNYQPIIIFLTDGEPYNGEKEPNKIISSITEINQAEYQASIFSLSFGNETNREFLQTLSFKNYGYESLIYDAADANLQLHNFFQKISDPVLKNINFTYSGQIETPTKIFIPSFHFRGSEIVVAGFTSDDGAAFENSLVTAIGAKGFQEFVPEIFQPVDHLERLWAFLSLKQSFQDASSAIDGVQYSIIAEGLAFKYSFVTPTTAMMVYKPDISGLNVTEIVYVP